MARLTRAPARLAAAPPRMRAAPKQALPFYQSAEWIALRAEVVRKRGSKCEREKCGRVGFVIADHVVEIKDGGAKLDPANIRLLCPACHGRKTAQAKAARMKGRGRRGVGESPQGHHP